MKGYSSQDKDDRGSAEFVTISRTGEKKVAMDVRDSGTVTEIGTDAVEAGSSTSVINATAHSAIVGDRIRFTSGALDTLEYDVESVTANTITVLPTMSVAPSAADTFSILRSISLTLSSTGSFTSAISYTLNGSSQVVTEDTGTPANNRPLPVKLIDSGGNISIDVANQNINVQTSHVGANADSMRIGDGTETVNINVSNELQVRDDDANTDLDTIAGGTTSLDAKTPALGTALIAASTPVNIASDQTVPVSAASLPLPTGAATEATLSTLNGKVTACDTGSVTISAALPAGTNNIGDVDIASSVLPTGAATEATLSTLDGKVTACNTGAVTVSSALPAGTNNIGDVDIASALPAGTNNIGDVDIASALPTGSNTIGAVNVNRLDVVQTNYVDFSSSNCPGNATNPLELQASSAAFSRIQIADTGGAFYEIMSGAAASEVREALIGPGSDSTVDLSIAATTRISIRRVDDAAALAVGAIAINYLG